VLDECGRIGVVTKRQRRQLQGGGPPVGGFLEVGHVGCREVEAALVDQQRLRFGRIKPEQRRVDFCELTLNS
jgi:hypothetical protein